MGREQSIREAWLPFGGDGAVERHVGGWSGPRVGVSAMVEEVAGDARLGRELVHRAHLPAERARFGELDPPLPAALRRALGAVGVPRLWEHQAAALERARRGEDVLVTTPTASGKSLVFQLPVLEEAIAGGPGRALFLFPLKALGQDQKSKLDRLAAAAGLVGGESAEGADAEPFCAIYDGDTPRAERAAVRKRPPRVVITNPDMLHLAFLGHWSGWVELLRTLRWVVIDELHAYRGIFGSHFHHVLRRLLRLARAEGARPSLIASSATAANAAEFAGALTGRSFHWVTRSGAPREGRHLLLLRPRTSPYTTALDLFTRLTRAGLKTIMFTKARRITELLYSWLRRQDRELARRVASYRAGFLPRERRRIEADLFSGKLDGVISTSALEMGIDVGGLDACVLVGYPGSIMATWQRSGRVGRDGRDSLTALVALPDALDQYFLDHPGELLARPCERLIVAPANRQVARAHLVCAAAERPLERSADAGYLDGYGELLGEMVEAGELLESVEGDELCSLRRAPQRKVGLRGLGATYRIVEMRSKSGRERTIGTVDGVRALHEGHPGAVYLHRGRQYLIAELDVEDRRARAKRVDLDYFTSPLTEKETEILEVLATRRDGPLSAWLGRVRVTERVVGFERKRIAGREPIDRHTLDLPPTEYETVALWWAAPPAIEAALRRCGRDFMGSLHAAEHAAIALFPLLAICDRGDIGGISMPFHPQVGCGTVFIYDGHPGGVGIAAAGFERLAELLGRVAEVVGGCECDDGCPSCVQSPKCGNGNRPLDKAGAVDALRLLLGEETPDRVVETVELRLDAVRPREEGVEEERPRVYRWRPQEPAEAADRGAVVVRHPRAALPEPPAPAAAPSSPPTAPATAAPAAFELASGPVSLSFSVPGGSGLASAMPTPDSPPNGTSPPHDIDEGRGSAPRAAQKPGRTSEVHAPGCPQPAEVNDFSAGAERSAEPSRDPGAAVLRPPVQQLPPPPWLPPPTASEDRLPDTVLFDVETLRGADEVGGWGKIHRMGLAVAVACHLEEGRFETFHRDEAERLADTLARATLVVGFNIKRFDYRVLSGYTGIDYTRFLPTFDLLEEIHRALGLRVGLGALAQATLGIGKSADGLQSLEWVRQGRLDLVEDYCRRDVEVMRDLYLHGRREGCVYLTEKKRGRKLRLLVEW